jgi:hypothetical protein
MNRRFHIWGAIKTFFLLFFLGRDFLSGPPIDSCVTNNGLFLGPKSKIYFCTLECKINFLHS